MNILNEKIIIKMINKIFQVIYSFNKLKTKHLFIGLYITYISYLEYKIEYTVCVWIFLYLTNIKQHL